MDKYPKTGGEEAVARNAAEFEADEIERLERICRPEKTFTRPMTKLEAKELLVQEQVKSRKFGHLCLIQTLPDCVFYKKNSPPDIVA